MQIQSATTAHVYHITPGGDDVGTHCVVFFKRKTKTQVHIHIILRVFLSLETVEDGFS